MTKKITVVVADDHPLVRKGIVATLAEESDFEVIGEATDGMGAQAQCKRLQPNILLLDLNMPGVSPLETIAVVNEHCPQTRVIILTAFDDLSSVRHMISAGAMGYLLKEEGLAVVVQAIRTVMQGGKWFSETVLMKLVSKSPEDLFALNRFVALNEREIHLLKLMAQGNSDYEIGQILGLAERTVRHYLRAIYDKLGVRSRVEAAVHAVRLGLLDESSDTRA
jgi:DNA-binding NarL/FixJ family response regulator